MSFNARVKIHARDSIEGRQATKTNDAATTSGPRASSIKIVQPKTRIPLTTTFTPPATCTENRLSQMPSPGFFVWANEPMPAPGTTVNDCLPSEFLRSYTQIPESLSGSSNVIPQSSVVPAMSPMAGCPSNYCTVLIGDYNYIACCPSNYTLHPPDSTIISDRPGYGGTCFSELGAGTTYTATGYDTKGATSLVPLVFETSGNQAFAHLIDGFATASPSVGCPSPSLSSSVGQNSSSIASSSTASSSSASSPSSTPAPPSPSRGTSGGTIAGAVVGSIAGLALIIAAVFFLLRRRRKTAGIAPLSEADGNPAYPMDTTAGKAIYPHEKDVYEMGRHDPTADGPFEMGGDSVPELDPQNDGKIKSTKRL